MESLTTKGGMKRSSRLFNHKLIWTYYRKPRQRMLIYIGTHNRWQFILITMPAWIGYYGWFACLTRLSILGALFHCHFAFELGSAVASGLWSVEINYRYHHLLCRKLQMEIESEIVEIDLSSIQTDNILS